MDRTPSNVHSNLLANPARSLSYPSDAPGPRRVDHYRLLKAMLECAPNEDGRRYVAAAIRRRTPSLIWQTLGVDTFYFHVVMTTIPFYS